MKSFVQVALVLAMCPVAALAQPVHFNVQCLPPAQQDEIKAKAQAIQDATAARRIAATQQVGSSTRLAELRADKEAKQSAFSECSFKARAAGQRPADACGAQLGAMAAATRAHTDMESGMDRAARPFAQEERTRLEELRAQYPTCAQPLLPDNPVIRK
ncbi:hypothetical protein FN976_08810 [Caenimonas sedimenti]|uniref:DUF1311 domain-containing protein n=1 Tax=Caenimonas sedimenti TaxID=2596921 RepID=A0A562ZTK3_9BURK|nr:hypothetical protein [Caenimonas sedimenti]TWO71701.1 hypothetical protein FN976_08810 [Caenimonas sedimenti]